MVVEAPKFVNVGDQIAIAIESARGIKKFDDSTTDRYHMFRLANALINHLTGETLEHEIYFLGVVEYAKRAGMDMELASEYLSRVVGELDKRGLISK